MEIFHRIFHRNFYSAKRWSGLNVGDERFYYKFQAFNIKEHQAPLPPPRERLQTLRWPTGLGIEDGMEDRFKKDDRASEAEKDVKTAKATAICSIGNSTALEEIWTHPQ